MIPFYNLTFFKTPFFRFHLNYNEREKTGTTVLNSKLLVSNRFFQTYKDRSSYHNKSIKDEENIDGIIERVSKKNVSLN